MKTRDSQSLSVLDEKTLTLIQECVCSSLPTNCSPREAVLRTLEFVVKVDALSRDNAALRFFYKSVVACHVQSGSTPLQSALSGHTLYEAIAPVVQEEAKLRSGKVAKDLVEDPNLLLTQQQLAKRWGLSIMTLNRWRREGRLPCHHMGRRIRFKLDDVLKFENQART